MARAQMWEGCEAGTNRTAVMTAATLRKLLRAGPITAVDEAWCSDGHAVIYLKLGADGRGAGCWAHAEDWRRLAKRCIGVAGAPVA